MKRYDYTKYINTKINRLYIIRINDEESIKRGKCVYECQCECGTVKNIDALYVLKGSTKSCGCLNKETSIKNINKYNSEYRNSNEIYLYDELGYGIAYFNNSNEYFLFDIEDLDIVKSRYWHKGLYDGYVHCSSHVKNIDPHNEFLFHRQVMGKYYNIDNKMIDHINHNKLDNRKENLQICNRSDNVRKSKLEHESNCGYKNIHRYKSHGKYDRYEFNISINGKRFYKSFDNIDDALVYRNNFYQEHPEISNYVYNPLLDVRNKSTNIISPFIDINTGQSIKRDIINPFIFV